MWLISFVAGWFNSLNYTTENIFIESERAWLNAYQRGRVGFRMKYASSVICKQFCTIPLTMYCTNKYYILLLQVKLFDLCCKCMCTVNVQTLVSFIAYCDRQ
ncbi:hypothetical protein NP493_877g01014 [Ridgeia piscesae]|uniref:Uncharacterized protein n=1 Tax=Ridgeia piscesae TaxID=27915 RepID=A0AAD9NM45_RIDPI|nr:hypothetical protein NP493_877g01014 [Ridgeia piscesae]